MKYSEEGLQYHIHTRKGIVGRYVFTRGPKTLRESQSILKMHETSGTLTPRVRDIQDT